MQCVLSLGCPLFPYPPGAAGTKKAPSLSAQGEQLSRSARVWTLGRFPFGSGWSAGRPAALRSPSLRSKLPRSPLLRASPCPWFHLNSRSTDAHSFPVTAGNRRGISSPRSRVPSRPALGGLAPSALSLAPRRRLLFPVTALSSHHTTIPPACQAGILPLRATACTFRSRRNPPVTALRAVPPPFNKGGTALRAYCARSVTGL